MDLVVIFCEVDDFCKSYVQENNLLLGVGAKKGACNMELSELLALLIYGASLSDQFKHFKAFYKYNCAELKSAFPGLLSYGRIIELRQEVILPMIQFLLSKLSPCTGKSYIDSTPLEACHHKRTGSHCVLESIASVGKTGNGWFYGTKLHMVVTPLGEIVNFKITPGNVADNNRKVLRDLVRKIWGKLFGDKGYIVKPETRQELYKQGVELVHNLRSNMKNQLLSMQDKQDLRKRANISEGAFNKLKMHLSLEHTRHRSPRGFLTHLVSILIAYQSWALSRAQSIREIAQNSLECVI